MRGLSRFFDFYINSSIHVALAVMAFVQITYTSFELETDYTILFFIGLATISGYNFVKFFGLAKFHHRSLANWLKIIQIFSLLCSVAMLYFITQMPLRTILYLGCFGLITFLYAIPLVPRHFIFDKNQNLRQIGGLKIYIIGFVWSAITVGLPLFSQEIDFNRDVIITLIQRFLIVLVLMLPFEIRDLRYDSIKLATIPQKIGIKNTKAIGALILVVIFNLEFFKDDLEVRQIIVNLIVMITILIFLLVARKNQSRYFSSFWVEGIPIFWFGLLLLFS